MAKKKKDEAITITFAECIQAQTFILQRLPNGQTQKSELAKAKGETGLRAYHLRHDLREACAAESERLGDLKKERAEVSEKIFELLPEKYSTQTQIRIEWESEASDKKKFNELLEKLKEVNKEIDSLYETEIKVTLKKGKFTEDEVSPYLDVEGHEILDFAIDRGE